MSLRQKPFSHSEQQVVEEESEENQAKIYVCKEQFIPLHQIWLAFIHLFI